MIFLRQLKEVIKDLPDDAIIWIEPGTQTFAGRSSSGTITIEVKDKTPITVEYLMHGDNHRVYLVTRRNIT